MKLGANILLNMNGQKLLAVAVKNIGELDELHQLTTVELYLELSYPKFPLLSQANTNFHPPNTGRPPHLSQWHQFATRSAIPQRGTPMERLSPSTPHSWIHGTSSGTGKLRQQGAGLVWFCGVLPSCLHPLLTTAHTFISRKKQNEMR